MNLSPCTCDPPQSILQGTPYFMALELLTGTRHRTSSSVPLSVAFLETAIVDEAMLKQLVRQGSTATSGVVCNFQHDLESLFWIALWIVLARVNYELSQAYAKLIYVNEIRATSERSSVFTDAEILNGTLSKKLHPSLESFIPLLATMAGTLFNAYLARDQENKVLEIGAYAPVYPPMLNLFYMLVSLASNADNKMDFPGLIDLHANKSIPMTNPMDSSLAADPHVGPSTPPVSTHGSPEAVTLTTVSVHGPPETITLTNPTFLLGSSEAASSDQVPLSKRPKRRQDESEDQGLPPSKRFHLPPPEHVLRQ
ncbi:hypothetical protein P691DRAFT_545909 [Macrolepiota fuliginosa MF-IS2]|uniref:Fungal-type protein kinase domain-containing protein n=1 Tax=Macrolepiota fuliginosa MF-IS2 TaxID=1400762 RepID=A0A9P5X009_9AGAR|nr:hypothetical protein P691DRAFT_545909 [Macrolepiota fuliginosa MF-IS2]